MVLAEPIQVTQLIAKVFDRLQIPYLERQWNDVLGVLQVQKENLDYSYLQRGTRNMGVATLLEQAIKDAGEAES